MLEFFVVSGFWLGEEAVKGIPRIERNSEATMRRRVRDPVHGLIVFDDTAIDQLAWQLVDTAPFQRLRRIRQLGVSEFTFPGALHTRFAHSLGVFHTARSLMTVIRREFKGPFEEKPAEVALIAALLHDVGHGPFSHTFEGVQRSRGVMRRHEQWTAAIIRNEAGEIRPLLEAHREGFAEEVAALLEKEDPETIYHAVVSSSFDADRLDYLRRDRQMTGTAAGAIDFDWLIDNLRVAEIGIDTPDGPEASARKVPTFCLTAKALPAAEQFLLARDEVANQFLLNTWSQTAPTPDPIHLTYIAFLSYLCQPQREYANGSDAGAPAHSLFGQGRRVGGELSCFG